MCCVCTASFPRRDRAHPRRNVLCLQSIVSTTRPRSPAQKRTVSAQHRFHDETALTRAEMCCVCTASFPRRDRAYPRRNVLCLHSIVSTTRPRSPAQKRTVSAQHRFHDETALTRAETYCVCTASFPRRDRAYPRRNVLCLHSIVSTTRPRLPAQKRTVFAQHRFHDETALTRAETYCVRTASFPRRDCAHPRRNVLCLHSIVSTTRPRLPAQKRTVSAQHRFHDETALTRAETYCVCTASFPRRDRAYPRRNVLCLQHLLNRRDRARLRRNVLCLHSIFSTDETALACAERTVSAQHLLNRRDRADRAEMCCVHSIVSTTRSRSPAHCVLCLLMFAQQLIDDYTALACAGRTVFAQHLIDDETALACAERTVFAQHLIERRDRARLRRAYCVRTVSYRATRGILVSRVPRIVFRGDEIAVEGCVVATRATRRQLLRRARLPNPQSPIPNPNESWRRLALS